MPNETIIKRTDINNSIFKELKEKWPPVAADNGVAYKQKLEYLTFETDFIEDPLLQILISKHGLGVISVIFYMRTEMCKNGWKVRLDGLYYDSLVAKCSFVCRLDEQCTTDILQALIDNRCMFVVQDTEVEEGEWLTCTQQVYNYEMACQKRFENRKRQKKHRAKSGSQSNQAISAGKECDDPFGISSEQEKVKNYPFSSNVGFQEIDDDPFGIWKNTPME
ncbi:MAG: hypothetical protein J1E03_04380 [Acetatifactor sp.]|nr:hypothetical protein [Acetatifactor sp.]